MAGRWETRKASEVAPGQRVRTPGGSEMVATRIESRFFGRDGMLAIIEDTDQRWYKQPLPDDADVEVLVEP